MKRYGTVLTLAAFLVAAAVPALAWGPWWGGKGQGPDGPRFESGQNWTGCPYYGLNDANLTDAQKAQLTKLDAEYSKKMTPIRDEMRLKKAEMNILIKSDTPDEKKIWDTQKEISSLRDRMDEERIRHQLAVKKIAPDATFGPGMGKGFNKGWAQRGCARI